MGAIGSVFGFFVGQADLPRALPALGRTQLQVLSVLVSVVLLVTLGATVLGVREVPSERIVDPHPYVRLLHNSSYLGRLGKPGPNALRSLCRPGEKVQHSVVRSLGSITSIPRTFWALSRPIKQFVCWSRISVSREKS